MAMHSTIALQQRQPALPARRSSHGAVAVPRPVGAQPPRAVQTHAMFLGAQLASTAILAAGAYFYLKQEALVQDRFEASDRRPCPSCGGSGLQPCFCTKWSDGDTGCSSCAQSGWTKCKSCGGGGMAVPIKVTIRKDNML